MVIGRGAINEPFTRYEVCRPQFVFRIWLLPAAIGIIWANDSSSTEKVTQGDSKRANAKK